jgi:signal transduction histidine kinase
VFGIAILAAVGVGLVAVVTAWRSPGLSATSASVPATALIVGAGAALVGVGLEHVRRGRRRRFGALLAAAGVAWLGADWASPAIGSATGFTLGLVAGWLAPAVVIHAVFLFANERLRRVDLLLVAAGYAVFGLALGLVPALTFDAAATRCSLCPPDLIAIAPDADVSGAWIGVASGAGTVVCAASAILLVNRLVRQTPAGRYLLAPVLIPGTVYALLVAVELGRGIGQPTIPTGGLSHVLRLGQAASLLAVAAGAAYEWVRARRSRTRVARFVAELGQSPPGGLRDTLASTLGDPDLVLAYRLAGGALVDADGSPVRLDEKIRPGRHVTPIVRDGVAVAVLEHRSDVLQSAGQLEDVIRAARLGIEHERLRAQANAQLVDLTAARKRIVAAAAAERQRLERDLHDGAQQQLVAISVGIRLLETERARLDEGSAGALAEASRQLALAIDELREVARGIYPSVLADEGLAAAVESLAEGAAIPIRLGDLEVDPIDLSIAEAAYAMVAEVVTLASGTVVVRASRAAGTLTVMLDGPDVPDDVVVELGDRIGAVDGVLRVHPNAALGRMELVAEIPCAS